MLFTNTPLAPMLLNRPPRLLPQNLSIPLNFKFTCINIEATSSCIYSSMIFQLSKQDLRLVMEEINSLPKTETIKDHLKRLPVKLLISFITLCEARSHPLRSSSSSSSYHSNKNPFLIIQRFHWDQQSKGLELYLFDIQSKNIKEFSVPKVTDSDMGFKIVGSCNGLICVCHYSHDPSSCIFLWNPATKQIKRIPEHFNNALLPYKAPPYCLLGFSHNDCVNNYEVVRIYPSESSNVAGIHAIQIERYSLKSGLWNEVKYYNHHGDTINGPFVWVENSLTIKRNMFWVAMTTKNQNFNQEFIVSYDIEKNMLRRINLPDFGNFEISKNLTECDESLGVLLFSESTSMDRCLELWIYNDKYNIGVDSWIKVKSIGVLSTIDRPVGMWNDEIFIAYGNVFHGVTSGLEAYLPSAQVAGDCCYALFNYVESLAAVDNGGNENQINGEDVEYSNKKKGLSLIVRVFKKLINWLLKIQLHVKRFKGSVLRSLTNFCNIIFSFVNMMLRYIRMFWIS